MAEVERHTKPGESELIESIRHDHDTYVCLFDVFLTELSSLPAGALPMPKHKEIAQQHLRYTCGSCTGNGQGMLEPRQRKTFDIDVIRDTIRQSRSSGQLAIAYASTLWWALQSGGGPVQ
jgi:hypothetical protein